MGLVQHEGGPCGVLAAIQVMATFSIFLMNLRHAVHFPKSLKRSLFQKNAKWYLFAYLKVLKISSFHKIHSVMTKEI